MVSKNKYNTDENCRFLVGYLDYCVILVISVLQPAEFHWVRVSGLNKPHTAYKIHRDPSHVQQIRCH